jgi:hypothetical protein
MSEPHTIVPREHEEAYQALLEGLSLSDFLEIPGVLRVYRACRKLDGVELTSPEALAELDALTGKELVYVIWVYRPLDILVREHLEGQVQEVVKLTAFLGGQP